MHWSALASTWSQWLGRLLSRSADPDEARDVTVDEARAAVGGLLYIETLAQARRDH